MAVAQEVTREHVQKPYLAHVGLSRLPVIFLHFCVPWVIVLAITSTISLFSTPAFLLRQSVVRGDTHLFYTCIKTASDALCPPSPKYPSDHPTCTLLLPL